MVHCHDDLATNVMFALSSSIIDKESTDYKRSLSACYYSLSSIGTTEILGSRCYGDVSGKAITLLVQHIDLP
jgi:hypothetical protein